MNDKVRLLKYLKWVIETHGEEEEIMSTNCAGVITKADDYIIKYGKAGDLKSRIEAGEEIHIPMK